MKTTENETKRNYARVINGILFAALLLGGGWVWAEKKSGEAQAGTDEAAALGAQEQNASLPALNPFRDMIQLQREMERIFGSTLSPYSGFPAFEAVVDQDVMQAMDLKENAKAYVVQMDLPGLEKSDIQIKVEDQLLTVSGERRKTVEQKDDEKIISQERVFSSFRREVVLPGDVDVDHVTAEYKAGVLTVTLPKTAEQKESHVISIK